MLLSKDEFVKTLYDLEKIVRYTEGLNEYFNKHEVDGYLFQPDGTDIILNLLHKIFGKADFNEWISYFVFDLDFGTKYKDGMVRDGNGQNIQLATASDLYTLLCESEV